MASTPGHSLQGNSSVVKCNVPKCTDAENSSKRIPGTVFGHIGQGSGDQRSCVDHQGQSPRSQAGSSGRGPREFLGRLEGIVEITGDIESPIEPADAWDAAR